MRSKRFLNDGAENQSIRNLFLGINSWNQNLARQKNVQLSLLPEGTDDPLANLKDKLTDAENGNPQGCSDVSSR